MIRRGFRGLANRPVVTERENQRLAPLAFLRGLGRSGIANLINGETKEQPPEGEIRFRGPIDAVRINHGSGIVVAG